MMILLLVFLATTGLQQDDQGKRVRPSLFDIQSANQTEVFVASDVTPEVEQAVKETLAVAVETWGSTGRLEYWVVGTDRQAALELGEAFCQRRVARGDMNKRDCLADRFNKDHGFLMYQKIGADALATGRPSMSAGHNGGSEWGIHRYSSSLPLGFANVLDIAAEGDQLTILHEYWHSVQMSFIQAEDHQAREAQMGPVWFAEGSAVAMAEITFEKLSSQGKLRSWKNSPRPWPNLEQRMVSKMKAIQERRKKCPTLLPDSYEGECRELAYDGGGWAIAYLMNKHGQDVLLKSFHPRVAKLGWEGAFRETFGQSSAEFMAEFSTFMDQPLNQQIKILPRF